MAFAAALMAVDVRLDDAVGARHRRTRHRRRERDLLGARLLGARRLLRRRLGAPLRRLGLADRLDRVRGRVGLGPLALAPIKCE